MTNYNKIIKSLETFGKKNHASFALTENDTRIYTLALMYFTQDPEFENQGNNYSLKKGLMIRGHIGVGKTLMMRTLQGFMTFGFKTAPFALKSCNHLNIEFMKKGVETIQEVTSKSYNPNTRKPYAICFDDLGAEPVNSIHYSTKLNLMETTLKERYDHFINHEMKTHITTNLLGSEIENRYGKRIRSRLKEMCNDIIYPGTDRRM